VQLDPPSSTPGALAGDDAAPPPDGGPAADAPDADAAEAEAPEAEAGGGRLGRALVALAVGALLLFGLGLRLQGLERSPLHYQPTRQLHTAIIARATYLDRTLPSSDPRRIAADRTRDHEEALEAPITEEVLATIYQVIGHESLWAAGVWSTSVWLAGGLLLFLLLRRFTTAFGALAGLAVHLTVPLGIVAGRSLQPDPLMVTGILATALLVVRHHERPSRGRLLAAGAVAGLTVAVKVTAAPVVALLWVAFALARREPWARRGRDALAFGACAVVPTVLSILVGFAPSTRGRSEEYFVASLLTRRSFYDGWFGIVANNIGRGTLLVAAAGLVVARGTARRLLATLIGAYLVLVVLFDYRMLTHTYYHLVLVPIVGLGCGLAAGAVPALVDRGPRLLARLFVPLVLLAAVAAGFLVWLDLPAYASDQRRLAAIHDAVAVTGPGAPVASMTSDYGRALGYYGGLVVTVELPGPEDRALLELQHRRVPSLDELLSASGADWVVVTSQRKLTADPEVQRELADHYRRAGQGDGWVVYDVRHRR
jgi:hypothetical protein